MSNTNDLSKFGFVELKETAKLLTAYIKNTAILNSGIQVEFNQNSGNVFLVDEEYNVAMLNGNNLEKFYTCGQCGNEGFLEDWDKKYGTYKGCVCIGCDEIRKELEK